MSLCELLGFGRKGHHDVNDYTEAAAGAGALQKQLRATENCCETCMLEGFAVRWLLTLVKDMLMRRVVCFT
jgi:hypothetical protein